MHIKFLPLSISLIILLTLCLDSYSQVRFGVKWGYNAPFVKGDMGWSKGIFDLKYPKDIITGHGGVNLMIPIGKVFAIQPEILYSKSAYSYYDPFTMNNILSGAGNDLEWIKKELKDTDADWTDSFHYISVPVLFKLRLKGFGIFAGPQYDNLVKATLQYFNYTTTKYERENHSENYKIGSHFSAVAGIDYTMRFGLGFNVRYQRGLTTIQKVSDNGIFSDENIMKNDLLMLGMHFTIGGSKKNNQ